MKMKEGLNKKVTTSYFLIGPQSQNMKPKKAFNKKI